MNKVKRDRLENRSVYYTNTLKTNNKEIVCNFVVGVERPLSLHSSTNDSGTQEF